MDELLCLIFYDSAHVRISMAEGVNSDAGREVQKGAVLHIVHSASFASYKHRRWSDIGRNHIASALLEKGIRGRVRRWVGVGNRGLVLKLSVNSGIDKEIQPLHISVIAHQVIWARMSAPVQQMHRGFLL